MSDFVIDASVLVELFVKGDLVDHALMLFDAFDDRVRRIYAPDAVYYEVAAALRKHEMRSEYSGFRQDIGLLADLDLRIIAAREVLMPAAEIAYRYRCSVYDAFYLAVAERHGVPLVTADRRLVNGMANSSIRVIHLSDFVAPRA
jgi:predicted nucleic acid-binding protein